MHRERGLAQRSEVLGAAVTIRVLGVGRAATQPHGEERERRGDHIAAGLDPRRGQGEAAGRQPDSQLQRHQQAGHADR